MNITEDLNRRHYKQHAKIHAQLFTKKNSSVISIYCDKLKKIFIFLCNIMF